MIEKMRPDTTTSPGGETGKIVPLPPAKVRLATVKEVRLELARLYRETKAGDIDPTNAAKLAFILDRIRVCLIDYELEARVAALEHQQRR